MTPGLPEAGMSPGTFYGGINRRDSELAAIEELLLVMGDFNDDTAQASFK